MAACRTSRSRYTDVRRGGLTAPRDPREITAMSRCSLSIVCVLTAILAGCLPPVHEVGYRNPPKEENAETAAADEAAAAAAEAAPAAQGFTKTPSGLQYKIIKPGMGRKPTAADTVVCHYKGWLDDGTEFDSSYKRGEPASFPLSGVIRGWTEGLQLIAEGGEIELVIPSRLGYGASGQPPTIPGGATLHFTVELQKVK